MKYSSSPEQRGLLRSLSFVRIDGLVLWLEGKIVNIIMSPPDSDMATYRDDRGVFLIATKGGELWCRYGVPDIDEWAKIQNSFSDESFCPGSLTSPFVMGKHMDPYDLFRRWHDPDWKGRLVFAEELALL